MRKDDSELLEHVAAAPFENWRWNDALTGLAHRAGGWGAQLIVGSARTGYVVNLAPGAPKEAVDELERWGFEPKHQPRTAAQYAPLMKVLGDSDLIEDEARQRSEFYAFARRWDVSFCCLSRIDQIDDLAVVVAVHRTEAAGHVETAERMAFGALLPHFQSAVRLQLRLEDQTALAGVGMMDAVGLAVVLCDRSGQVQAVSAAAEVVLSVGAAATVRGGRLYGTNDKSNAALQSAIARAAASQKDVSGPRASRIYLRGHKDDGPSAADVTPVPRTMNGFNLGSAVLVVLEPRRLEAGNRTHEVRKLYGLTKTEADVAIALASGSSVADISEQRGVRISTLRSQVACILAKTRTSRQAELVALLSRPAKQTSG